MKPIIVGIDSRCRHGEALVLGSSTCEKCEHEDLMLNRSLPFAVQCVDDRNCDLIRDRVYTAVGVMVRGKAVNGTELPGLLLRSRADEYTPRVYHMRRFIEVEHG